MDYYKTIYDNLNSGGFPQMTLFTVNDECFDYETKRTLYTVFHSIGNVVKCFLPKDIHQIKMISIQHQQCFLLKTL